MNSDAFVTLNVVPKRDLDSLRELVQELEDRLWLLKAEAASRDGYASTEEVDAFLGQAWNGLNEANDIEPKSD